MRTCSKERTNIPITISVLHDLEYQQLCRLLHRSGRRRAFTEKHIELDPLSKRQSILPCFQQGMDRKTATESKGQQVASTQMIHQEVDA